MRPDIEGFGLTDKQWHDRYGEGKDKSDCIHNHSGMCYHSLDSIPRPCVPKRDPCCSYEVAP